MGAGASRTGAGSKAEHSWGLVRGQRGRRSRASLRVLMSVLGVSLGSSSAESSCALAKQALRSGSR